VHPDLRRKLIFGFPSYNNFKVLQHAFLSLVYSSTRTSTLLVLAKNAPLDASSSAIPVSSLSF
jgi:hypothetical protein